MFVINKKRISFILIMIIVSMIGFYLPLKKQDTIETVSLPISGKTIVLDAGHGYPDQGAESVNGITEASLNLIIKAAATT